MLNNAMGNTSTYSAKPDIRADKPGNGASSNPSDQRSNVSISESLNSISNTRYGKVKYKSPAPSTELCQTFGRYMSGYETLRQSEQLHGARIVYENTKFLIDAAMVVGAKQNVADSAKTIERQNITNNNSGFGQLKYDANKSLEIAQQRGVALADNAKFKVDFNNAKSVTNYKRILDSTGEQLGLGPNVTKLNDETVRDILANGKKVVVTDTNGNPSSINRVLLSNEEKNILTSAYRVSHIDKLTENSTINTINRLTGRTTQADELVPGESSVALPKLDLNSRTSVRLSLSAYSKTFRQKNMEDYTRYSVPQLEKILKNQKRNKMLIQSGKSLGTNQTVLSDDVVVAIQQISILKKHDVGLADLKRAKGKRKMSAVTFVAARLRGNDAFDGARMIYSSLNTVKSALTLAETVRRITGEIAGKFGVKGKTRPPTRAQIKAQKQLAQQKAREQSLAIKRVAQKNARQEKLIAKRLTKKQVRIQAGKPAESALTRVANQARASAKKAAQTKFAQKARAAAAKTKGAAKGVATGAKKALGKFAKIPAALKVVAVYAAISMCILVVISQFSHLATSLVYAVASISGAAVSDASGNNVENVSDSFFVNTYNEIVALENNWFADLDGIENKAPYEVLTDDDGAPRHVYGYYDPTAASMHEITEWGYTSISDDEEHSGFSLHFHNGMDEETARFSNIKMCMSLGHAFVNATYTDDNMQTFHDFCVGLWQLKRDDTNLTPTAVYACPCGCANYHYYCNQPDAFALNTTNPDKDNYVRLIDPITLGAQTTGCLRRVYNAKTITGYTDYRISDGTVSHISPYGNVGTKDSYSTTHTWNIKVKGVSKPVTQSTTIPRNTECNCTTCTFCSNSELSNPRICSNPITIYCSGCQTSTPYHTTSKTLTKSTSEVYKNIQKYYDKTTQKMVTVSAKCSSPTRIPACTSQKISTIASFPGELMKVTVMVDNAPANCPTRVLKTEYGATVYNSSGKKYTNATYSHYVCHCNECTYCNGHTETSCPGHTVCGGHIDCQGHDYCPGHDVKICLGHIDIDVVGYILNKDDVVTEGEKDNTWIEADLSDMIYTDGSGHEKTYEKMCEDCGFTGWGLDSMCYYNELYNQDWYDLYGLAPNTMAGYVIPLASQEMQAIKEKYLTDEEFAKYEITDVNELNFRKDVCDLALSSVGRIPYYWGGDAYYKGMDERNRFGAPASYVATSSSGRKYYLVGLDCAGFVGFVYWSCDEGKYEAIHHAHHDFDENPRRWTHISWKDAKPGDPVIQDGHIGLFIAWANEEHTEFILIDETPPSVTCHISSTAGWWCPALPPHN